MSVVIANNLATSFSPCIRRGKRARAWAGGTPWGCWAGGSGCRQWVSVPGPAPRGLHKCLVAGVCSLHCHRLSEQTCPSRKEKATDTKPADGRLLPAQPFGSAQRPALPAAWSFVSPFLCPQGLAVLQALPATNPPKSWLLVVPEWPWGDGVERAEPGAPRPAAQGGSVCGDACSGAGASISPLFFLSGE